MFFKYYSSEIGYCVVCELTGIEFHVALVLVFPVYTKRGFDMYLGLLLM